MRTVEHKIACDCVDEIDAEECSCCMYKQQHKSNTLFLNYFHIKN